jgi:DNA-binding protein Fis
LPYDFEIPESGISLLDLEKSLIKQALQKANYNQTRAAQLLGVSRDSLRYKKKKYQL